MTSLSTPAECAGRGTSLFPTAEALHDSDDPAVREWSAVAFFYSAYHLARAALLSDPVFDSVPRLTAISPKLAMEDRTATHHQGRRSGDGHRLGVSELVTLLYPGVKADYAALHQASIQVRYGSRLIAPLGDLRDRSARILDAYGDGRLVAT